MPATVSIQGARLDILIRQGVDTCTFTLTVTDPVTGDPISLSDYTWSGGVYAVATRALVTPWVFDTTFATSGVVKYAISAADTAPLSTVDSPEVAAYTHVLYMTDDQGRKFSPIFGDFRVIWGTGA